jgi:hypothetical protein
MSDEYLYIRRSGNIWVRARSHHQEALLSFLYTPYNLNNPVPIEVSVPHEDGGVFTANITRNNERNQRNRGEVFEYFDEYGRCVYIMTCNPEIISYINRNMFI